MVVLPLLIMGSEAAHAVLALFAPASYQGAEVFELTRNSEAVLPVLIGVAVLAASSAGHVSPHVARRVFAALPLIALAIQEYVEHTIGHGDLSWTVVTHPAFAYGLALQLSFAAVAYLGARLLIVLADAVAWRLRVGRRRPRLDLRPTLVCSPGASWPRTGRPSGDARFNRGPPRPMYA